jgi:hypothetical protein
MSKKLKTKIQEHEGNYHITVPTSIIALRNWKKGDIIIWEFNNGATTLTKDD